jgi:Transglycosylase-like domain
LRNHTAKPSINLDRSHQAQYTGDQPGRFLKAVLCCTVGTVLGFTGLTGTVGSALAAEPNGLPQAYSAKIVDTASLLPVVSVSPPSESGGGALSSAVKAPVATDRKNGSAPVVSMLPVPSTKPDPAATTTAKSKKQAKKAAPTTSEAPSVGEEAIALPVAAKPAKVSDTKAPAETTKEASSSSSSSSNSGLDAAFAALRKCESGGNYKINTGNGYYGAYQFDPKTWRALGYSGLPSDAAPEVQDEAARKLLAKAGWGQWPACSRKLGLR